MFFACQFSRNYPRHFFQRGNSYIVDLHFRMTNCRFLLATVSEVATGPELTPAEFCFFLSDPDPEQKICEKPDPESLFHFGSSRSLRGHFLSKNMGNFRLDR